RLDQIAAVVNWEGNTECLRGHEEGLANSEDLCEEVFMSKREAFSAGLNLGREAASACSEKIRCPVSYDRSSLISEAEHLVGEWLALWFEEQPDDAFDQVMVEFSCQEEAWHN